MVLSIFSAGCSGGGEGQPISSETSKYQVADGDSQSGGEQPSAVTLAAEGDGQRSPAEDVASRSEETLPRGASPVAAASGGAEGANPAGPGAAAGGVPMQQPPSVPSQELNTYAVPDGTPEELMQFIRGLPPQPRGSTNEEFLADYENILNAALKASEKILAADASPELRQNAARVKLNSLTRLASQLQVADAVPRIRTFSQQLKNDANPELAVLGRLTLFGLLVGDFAAGTPNQSDPNKLVDEMNALLSDRALVEAKGADVFGVTVEAATALQRAGHVEQATAAFEKIATTFDSTEDEQMAAEVGQLKEYLNLVKLDFSAKQDAALMGKPEAVEPFLKTIDQALQAENAGPMTLGRVREAGHYMEITHNTEAARAIYSMIGPAYASHANPELAAQAAETGANGLRRVDLIGKPFVVEGVLPDGTPFDWAAYRGKVVLVDFWASWCGPCLQEFPNVAREYQRYRDKGFEVVGVNLDEEPAERDRFLASQGLPWPTVISADPQAQGFDNPLAVKCGIEAIPFMVLVNKEGIVVATHTRGEELGERLAAMLGPVEEEQGPGPAGGNIQPEVVPPNPGPLNPSPPPASQPPAGQSPTSQSSPAPPADAAATWFVSFQEESTEPEASESTTGDSKAGAEPASGDQAPESADDDDDGLPIDPNVNPYRAPEGLSSFELVDYILDMQEKPQTIQRRPGFAAAVADAADRVLAGDASDKLQTIAALAKFQILHDAASFDDQQADQELAKFVERMKDDPRPKIAQEVAFLRLEREVLGVDELPLNGIPPLLDKVHAFLGEQKLVERHLRIASETVHAINRLEDADERERQFQRFGKLFAASSSKELARYGKKLAKSPAGGGSDLVGEPLELAGVTTLGTPFDWAPYRGKVVLVDFWATWCGPCRKAMPKVKALYEKLRDQPFDVVGVSLDQDLEALGDYLAENKIAWVNLAGEETQELARKYGVKGIPTMMLVDTEGKIVAVSHNIDELAGRIEKLLKDAEQPASS